MRPEGICSFMCRNVCLGVCPGEYLFLYVSGGVLEMCPVPLCARDELEMS